MLPRRGDFNSQKESIMLQENLLPKTSLHSLFSSEKLPASVEAKKTFRHSIDICLKDSNAYGNTYFARYFEWQGVCREQWFYRCISSDMLQTKGVFITKCAHQNYAHETFPFQTVQCHLNSFEIKSCSFYLQFSFFVNDVLISTGYQQLVFANHNKKIVRLPQYVIDEIRRYEDSSITRPN